MSPHHTLNCLQLKRKNGFRLTPSNAEAAAGGRLKTAGGVFGRCNLMLESQLRNLSKGRLKTAAEERKSNMAGHSKWANIQHKKARQDAKRGKIFTRLIKEITVAARMGGGDPGANPRLRLALEKAAENNMPKDNVQRAIDKGTGNFEGVEYIELRYEGYGIGGAALMVDCLTDNKTRTVADVRHAFTKNGGNLGTDGCVAFNFVHQGYLVFEPGVDEDALMEAALEAGAEDVITNDDGSIEVITAPNDWAGVKAALETAGYKSVDGDVTMRAQNETELSGEDAVKMQKLIDALEDLDDVQDVYTSAILDLA